MDKSQLNDSNSSLKGLSKDGQKYIQKHGEYFEEPENIHNCHFFDAADFDEEFLVHPSHRAVYSAWNNARGNRSMAEARTIDPLMMRKALGDIMILEPVFAGQELDFVFRLYGSNVAGRYGKDMTRKHLSEFPQLPPKLTRKQYIEMIDQCRPLYSEHNAPDEVSVITRWCRLSLPYGILLEDKSYKIERILTCKVAMSRAKL